MRTRSCSASSRMDSRTAASGREASFNRSARTDATVRQHAGAAEASPAGRISDDILITATAFETENAFRLQLLHHRQNLLLRRLHIADSHRPGGFHVFAQHFGATLRHTLQKVIFQLIAGAL